MLDVSKEEVEHFVSSIDFDDREKDWTKFCKHWLDIRDFLEYIERKVGFPANVILKSVIALGDAIKEEKCEVKQ